MLWATAAVCCASCAGLAPSSPVGGGHRLPIVRKAAEGLRERVMRVRDILGTVRDNTAAARIEEGGGEEAAEATRAITRVLELCEMGMTAAARAEHEAERAAQEGSAWRRRRLWNKAEGRLLRASEWVREAEALLERLKKKWLIPESF